MPVPVRLQDDAAPASLHPPSLTKWRQRVGAARLEVLPTETHTTGLRENHAIEQELARLNVDTTVQEKFGQANAGSVWGGSWPS